MPPSARRVLFSVANERLRFRVRRIHREHPNRRLLFHLRLDIRNFPSGRPGSRRGESAMGFSPVNHPTSVSAIT